MTGPAAWGFLSTASINDHVYPAFAALECAELLAVASRDLARAAYYAKSRGIPRAYGSYETLLDDPEIEAVYVSLPNALHYEWAARALEGGKAVLCEKPLTTTAAQAVDLFDRAERLGCVLMEAFMYLHHPQTRAVCELVRRGALGEVQTVHAWLSCTAERERDIRLDPTLGGGALRDLGCYCISFPRLLTGEEPSFAAACQFVATSGVDERTSGLLMFPSGVSALFDVSLRAPLSQGLTIVGSEGILEVPMPWHPHRSPQAITIRRDGGEREEFPCPGRDCYELEIENLSLALRGESSPAVTREHTIGNLRVMELIESRAIRVGASC